MLKKLTIFTFLYFFSIFSLVGLNIHARSFSLDHLNEHILQLRKLKNEITTLPVKNYSLASTKILKSLRQSSNYAQSLTEHLIEDYNNGGVDPYGLNLIHEFLSYQVSINQKINSLSSLHKIKILEALNLINIKKINDLFFSNKGIRAIYKDQMRSASLGLEKWQNIVKSHLNSNYINSLNIIIKNDFYPIEKIVNHTSSKEIKSLAQALKESTLYRDLQKNRSWTSTLLTNQFWAKFSDNANERLNALSTGASALFGALAGNIAWRQGYLKDDKNLIQYMGDTLQPFDLLMEKKAYKLTDLTIPGHWGHIGVYLGTKKQLIKLGLWKSKALDPFRENIERGKHIFQVRRTGLSFERIENFINLDEMAILRIENQSHKARVELELIFEYLANQLNKGYDFSFNAMTSETITCTEIIAFSYGPIKWPMDYILGRYSISPNNMAELALFTKSPLKIISYITGDRQGTHYRNKNQFAQTLGYSQTGSKYKKVTSTCKRKIYRHNRREMRFNYTCQPALTEKVYSISK